MRNEPVVCAPVICGVNGITAPGHGGALALPVAVNAMSGSGSDGGVADGGGVPAAAGIT